eukprot:scaffold163189_cov30-Tisochrysis_lutea.AAC.3
MALGVRWVGWGRRRGGEGRKEVSSSEEANMSGGEKLGRQRLWGVAGRREGGSGRDEEQLLGGLWGKGEKVHACGGRVARQAEGVMH